MTISSRNPPRPTPPSPSNIITSEVLIQSDSDSDLEETHRLHVAQQTAAQTSLMPPPSDGSRFADDDGLSFGRTEETSPASSSLPEARAHRKNEDHKRDNSLLNNNVIDDRIKNHHDVLPSSSTHHHRRRQTAHQPIAYRVKSPPLHHYYRQSEENLIRHQPSISFCRPFCMLVIILILSLMTYLENVGNILSYRAGKGGGADGERFRGRVRVRERGRGKNEKGFKLFGKSNLTANAVVNGSDAIVADEDVFGEGDSLTLFPTVEDGQNLIESNDLDDDDSIPVDDDGYDANNFDDKMEKGIYKSDVDVNATDEQETFHVSSEEDLREGLLRYDNADLGDSIARYEDGSVKNEINHLENDTSLADEGFSIHYNITDNSDIDSAESEGLSLAVSNTLTEDLDGDVWTKMNDQSDNDFMYSEAINAANDELHDHSRNITTEPTAAAAEDDQPPLPEGWMEDILPQLGKPYYYNKMTGESSLERPLPNAVVVEETDIQADEKDDIHFGFNDVSSENAPFP